uniref:Uncharacterized protein n=1 Tax=Anopheles melas TaxID=34690 RepID=A0A182UKZ1_9DIPT
MGKFSKNPESLPNYSAKRFRKVGAKFRTRSHPEPSRAASRQPEPIGAVQSRSEQSELLMPSEPSEPVGAVISDRAGWSRRSCSDCRLLQRLQPAPTGSDGSDGINSSDCSDRLCTAPIGSGRLRPVPAAD